MGTDRKILNKGISYLAWALPLMFIGPSAIYNAFINKQNVWHYLVLAIGIAGCFGAVYFMFIGLRTIIKSMFGD
jgi:polyferredoxin